MKMTQVYEILNAITSEILGDSIIVAEDLSNIVDVGKAYENMENGLDNFVRALNDQIGRVVFVDRVYRGRVPSVLMDGWEYGSIMEKIRGAGRPVSVLNLFGYTGAATVAAAKAGASVCHVDAAKGMVAWGKENAEASGVREAPIRWIVDDCAKFVEREIRRGRRYDAIIMDPPSYGRGPGGEVWRLEDNIWDFVELTSRVLSDDPLFVIINSYTTGLAPSVLGYILQLCVQYDAVQIAGNSCGIRRTLGKDETKGFEI